MFSTQSSRGYRPLEDRDLSSSSEDLDTKYTSDSHEPSFRLLSRLTYLAAVTVIVCTVVDFIIILCFSFQVGPIVTPSPRPTELRSSYITLDVLYSKGNVNSSRHAPIINHAQSFVQVSRAEPEAIIPTYHTGFHKEDFGLVPFMSRRLHVTPETSTVAQFRAIDFGMESCSLAIRVPPVNETDGQILSSPTLSLDVYRLPIYEKLDLHAVSFSSLPTTKVLFAQLILSEDSVVQTPTFPCQTLSYHTYMLACSEPDCYLDLIGAASGESGLFMYQHQTI